MSLKRFKVEKNTSYLFFRNPPLTQISTFSLGQKGCAYYEESAYLGCAYYEDAQYNTICQVVSRSYQVKNRCERSESMWIYSEKFR